jgi:hypothetical protein
LQILEKIEDRGTTSREAAHDGRLKDFSATAIPIEKLTAKQGEVDKWKPGVDKKVDELRDAMFNSGDC